MSAPPRPVAIVGAGKLGDLLLDCLEGDHRYEVVAFLDDGRAGGRLAGVPIFSPDDHKLPPGIGAFLAIGFPSDRQAMLHRCRNAGLSWLGFIDRRAIVSPRAKIGAGVLVLSFAMVAATTTLGDFVYVSSYARIGAHAQVGDFTSVLSGAAIGGSIIGAGCMIGTNSSCLDGAAVGDGATVGPHAVVRGAVPAAGMAVAHPGRITARPVTAA